MGFFLFHQSREKVCSSRAYEGKGTQHFEDDALQEVLKMPLLSNPTSLYPARLALGQQPLLATPQASWLLFSPTSGWVCHVTRRDGFCWTINWVARQQEPRLLGCLQGCARLTGKSCLCGAHRSHWLDKSLKFWACLGRTGSLVTLNKGHHLPNDATCCLQQDAVNGAWPAA